MTTEKLNMKTTDMADENFRKLQELFPEAVTEIEENGKIVRAIDKDKLQQLISTSVVDGSKERYQFTWPGKREAVLLANTPTNKTLRPVKGENKTDDACFNTTENLYIEGDNLEVLKLLQEKYLGRIKMIYIDPPYNTGNDFIYKDNFAQNAQNYVANSGQTDEEGNRLVKNVESNGRFHSDWLSMMYPRLKIARNLLADDGVIFISIDDNEQENLKKLCDEVFGEVNYINQLAWVSNITGRQIAGQGAAKTWESILIYSKNSEKTSSFFIDVKAAKEKMPDTYKGFNKDIREDSKGLFAIGDTLFNHNRKFNEETRPNLVYSIFYNPLTGEIKAGNIGEKFEGFVEILPHKNGDGIHKYHAWRWSRQKVENETYDLIVLPSGKKGYEIYTRIRDFNKTLLKDLITNISNGDSELQKMMDNKKYFDYPKSVDLLKILLATSLVKEDSIILDFFSGSATTAHAVMQLNAEDGGNRKFIMVQLPEVCDEKSEAYKAGYNTICDIGKERIRRAGAKIKEELEKTNPERAKTLDTGFRVLRLDSSNMKDVFYRPVDLKRDELMDFTENVKEDRNEMDLLFQIMPELNADYTSKIEETYEDGKKIFNVESNYIVACFAENISEKVIRKVASYKPDYAVFRDSCFPKDSNLANVEQIFRAESPETRLRIL